MAWSVAFGRRFADSLAPALMTNILLVLVAGMTVRSLTFGFALGLLLDAAMLLAGVWRCRRDGLSILRRIGPSGALVFSVAFVVLYLLDTGKVFLNWDEFGFWGLALKDTLRLDELYAVSELPYRHKDYVPAVTLFEYQWVTLAGRYLEADLYRCIQVLMFSLLLPSIDSAGGALSPASGDPGRRDDAGGAKESARRMLARIGASVGLRYALRIAAALLLLEMPFAFTPQDGFLFYHSIYLDYFSGIVLAYCFLEAYRRRGSFAYRMLVLAIGMSVMVLSKMTLAVMLPAILLFVLVAVAAFGEDGARLRLAAGAIGAGMVPIVLWLSYNSFVARFVDGSEDTQTFSGTDPKLILSMLFDPSGSGVAYAEKAQLAYLDAIFSRPLVFGLNYVVCVGILAAAALAVCVLAPASERERTVLAALWTGFANIGYAVMMYALYPASFTEAEALRVASFERYMNAQLLATAIIILGLIFELGIWRRLWAVSLAVPLGLAIWLAVAAPDSAGQIAPGQSEEAQADYENHVELARPLLERIPEDSSVLVIAPGDTGRAFVRLRYLAFPRALEGAIAEADMAHAASPEEVQAALEGIDYVYLTHPDKELSPALRSRFAQPEEPAAGLYKVEGGEPGGERLVALDAG